MLTIMTISKKLYLGFGSIVVILVVLFVTNSVVVFRERSASQDAYGGDAECGND